MKLLVPPKDALFVQFNSEAEFHKAVQKAIRSKGVQVVLPIANSKARAVFIGPWCFVWFVAKKEKEDKSE